LSVQNKSTESTKIRIRVEYFDAEGFSIDQDNNYPDRPLAPDEVRAISGHHFVDVHLAEKIQSAKAFVVER
jgi:hypothetical protein